MELLTHLEEGLSVRATHVDAALTDKLRVPSTVCRVVHHHWEVLFGLKGLKALSEDGILTCVVAFATLEESKGSQTVDGNILLLLTDLKVVDV